MVEGKRDLASMTNIGDLAFTTIIGTKSSIAKTRRIHLPIYIVALAISITVLDSLTPIKTKLLIDIISLSCAGSRHRSACEGSLRVGSGIRGAKRVVGARYTNHQYHTSQRTKDDTSINISYLLTIRLIQQSTNLRGSRIALEVLANSSCELGGGIRSGNMVRGIGRGRVEHLVGRGRFDQQGGRGRQRQQKARNVTTITAPTSTTTAGIGGEIHAVGAIDTTQELADRVADVGPPNISTETEDPPMDISILQAALALSPTRSVSRSFDGIKKL